MNLKPGYSGSRRPGDAENIVRSQKQWGKKRENGMSDLKKKSGKSDVKLQEMKKPQGDDKDALHYIQQHKSYIQKIRKK